MPTSPEVGEGRREVWHVEVDRNTESEECRRAARDVGVTREVEVDLQCESQRRDPGIGRADSAIAGGAEPVVDPDHHPVAEEHLLREAPADEPETLSGEHRVESPER